MGENYENIVGAIKAQFEGYYKSIAELKAIGETEYALIKNFVEAARLAWASKPEVVAILAESPEKSTLEEQALVIENLKNYVREIKGEEAEKELNKLGHNMKLTNGGMARLYKVYTLLAYLIPMTVLFIIKRSDYSTQGSIFGFWGIIVLILCVIMFKNFCVEFFKKYRILTVSIILLIVGIFAEFLSSQLIVIGICSVIASILSLLISVVADTYEEHAYKVIDGEKKVNTDKAITQKEAWKEAYGYNFI